MRRKNTLSKGQWNGGSAGHRAGTDTRLTAAAVTQSVTLALAADNAADRAIQESPAHTTGTLSTNTPKDELIGQHWIHISASRSPEIQPCVNEAICVPSPIGAARDIATAETKCKTWHSSSESQCIGVDAHSTDSCSVPFTAPDAAADMCSILPITPVMELYSDDTDGVPDFGRHCGRSESVGFTPGDDDSSRMLPFPLFPGI